MFRKLLPVYVVAAFMASTLLPSPAQAESVFKNYLAWAYFYDAPPGCEYFETYLEVVERWTRYEPGPTTHTLTFIIHSIHYDACEDRAISFIVDSVEIPPNTFRSQGLKLASLQLAINFRAGVSGAIVPVILDLAWACDADDIGGKPSKGACGDVELSGSAWIGSRDLMDSEYISGVMGSHKN